ncbi:MAG: ATP-grasp domain-containing protein [Xanthobacteraceae bacterium]
MTASSIRLLAATEDFCAPRIGVGNLIRQAFQGADLKQIWAELMAAVEDKTAGPGTAMDLSIVAQLLGDQAAGLAIQTDVLRQHRVYWSRRASGTPPLRLLAFAAALDLGGNTPVDFLIEDADIELYTVYVVPGLPLPIPLPLHDIAIVTVPDSIETRGALAEIEQLVKIWPRPVVNLPRRISGLDRDRLFDLIRTVRSAEIPATRRIDRAAMARLGDNDLRAADILGDGTFPLIVRPVGSHAGKGLEKLDDPSAVHPYLTARSDAEFFISRYVDYSSADGQFRKYRIAFVDGRAYPCHMAISDQWKVWYLNANMDADPAKRAEEAHFMVDFDRDFGARHRDALIGIADTVGLEYFVIDCAETRSGRLLMFEADVSMIVHDMDSPATYPYKSPQMRRIFAAFAEMLRSKVEMAAARSA